ncbi:hypothetical protein PVAND_009351 [Polypedilum vanderplanki]|uniref:ABC transporter domain-containing protein n=1 Tax=Polypedilum vanderplanki TaxID=319348 RepID=A0A9J6CD14_POLVA|nr:hypothetical protein PVAND_009351 [Polypedilum vanderplanki]
MTTIQVRQVKKSFKTTENVLNNFSLSIKTGSIYALVGSSGCGKTTFINCLLGIQKIDKGEIKIFNQNVKLQSTSKLIGYMPQQISLASQLTIKETFKYFASLHLIDKKFLKERTEMLSDLLCLPPEDSLIKNISGGEQRRVSFAVAVLHDPKLLILDEPTVGLDVEIRQRIWKFLHQQSSEKNITILFTTQYLTEVAQAHCCGFLRNGNLIVENSHDKLLENFNVETIDEAFYKICCLDEDQKIKIWKNEEEIEQDLVKVANFGTSSFENSENLMRFQVLKGLLTKEWRRIRRAYIEIFLFYIFSYFLLSGYANTIGKFPDDLRIGIVNYDSKHCESFKFSMTFDECFKGNMSCEYVNNLEKIIKIPYDTHEEAYKDFLKGKIFGFLIIKKNFTKSLENVLNALNKVEDVLDPSAYHYCMLVKLKAFRAFAKLIQKISTICEIFGAEMMLNGINHEHTFMKDSKIDIMRNRSPNMILLFVFAITLAHSGLIIYECRLEGIWNRSFVNGLKITELLAANLIQCFLNSTIISIQMIFYLNFIIKVEFIGSYWMAFLIMFLVANVGHLLGLLKAIVFDNIFVLTGIGCAYIASTCFVSGLFWPIEFAPKFIQILSYYFPISIPAIALHEVIFKRSEIFSRNFQIAFFALILHVFIYISVSFLVLRRRKFIT